MVNLVNAFLSPDWRYPKSPDWRRCGMQNRIRKLRLDRGLTLDQLAERAGTTLQQLSRLERAERRLTDEWMTRLSNALGVRPVDLLPDSGPDTREFLQNPEEVGWIKFWRLLSDDERMMMIAFAKAKGIEILSDKPKKRRA
jgi:transcriptional regulator with XRE-family HTH domain